MAVEPTGKLAEVTGTDVSIDPVAHYDGWAETYEADLLGTYGYCAHRIAVEALVRQGTNRGAEIIDVGCGTGLVGAELARHGFRTFDGVDVSGNMLAKARALGLYRRLIAGRIGDASVVPCASYDVVLCVGSFGLGHLGSEAMRDLIAMGRAGARIVIFMNAEPYDLDGYADHIRALEADGLWTVDDIENHNYMEALDRPGKLILARHGSRHG